MSETLFIYDDPDLWDAMATSSGPAAKYDVSALNERRRIVRERIERLGAGDWESDPSWGLIR